MYSFTITIVTNLHDLVKFGQAWEMIIQPCVLRHCLALHALEPKPSSTRVSGLVYDAR